uniref:ATP-grasp domain-containing protein n=1 Tax=viral metagenome TaxID=1070528 RepID=A0A6C0CZ08_9ZZZZ
MVNKKSFISSFVIFILVIIFVLVIIFLVVYLLWKFIKNKKKIITYSLLRGPNQWAISPLILINSSDNIFNNLFIEKVVYILHHVGYEPHSLSIGKLNDKTYWIKYDGVHEEIIMEAVNMVVENRIRLQELEEQYSRTRLGISTNCIVEVAKQQGIQVTRLNKDNFIVLGNGVSQKRIMATVTSNTLQIGVDIVQNKQLTKQLLSKLGIPVPRGRILHHKDDAWSIMNYMKNNGIVRFVIKPSDSHQGKGITINPVSRTEIERAISFANTFSKNIMVEELIEGNDYRVLVIHGKIVAIAKRTPPLVIGDGQSTIFQLLERLNQDPLRKKNHDGMLTIVKEDIYVLQKQGFQSVKDIPSLHQKVLLRQESNLSMGGTSTDEFIHNIHPQNKQYIELAVRMVGLDVAGVDIVSNDLSIPLKIQGAITEINAAPGLRMHILRQKKIKENIGTSIVNYLSPCSIPIIAITGVNGKTTTTLLISHILQQVYSCVGSVTTNGIYVNQHLIRSCDCSGPQSARAILQHPKIEAAVLEVARGGIIREGLGYHTSTVGIFLNIGQGDHLGQNGIHTLDDLFRVKSTVLKSINQYGFGVVNANDAFLKQSVMRINSKNIVWYSIDPTTIPFQCKDYVTQSGQHIIVIQKEQKVFEISVNDIRFTHFGTLLFNIENMMAGLATASGLQIPWCLVKKALLSFEPPKGRANILPFRNGHVILDYAHNVDSIHAIVHSLPSSNRTIIMFGAAGDRREEDIVKMTDTLSRHCQDLLLYEDINLLRGRQRGEIQKIMETTARKQKQVRVQTFSSEESAINKGFAMFEEGNVVLFLLDDIETFHPKITDFISKGQIR